MKFMEQRKRVSGHYRARLLKLFSDMNLSYSLRLRISKIIGQLNQKESELKAKETIEMIQDCKTEQEVIQALKLEQ